MSLSASASFPEWWSREMQRNNDIAVVIAPLVSRKFQGDLSKGGDTVYFDQWPDLLTRSSTSPHGVTSPVRYTRGADIADSSHTVTQRSLVVNQEWAFREVVDDVDDFQSIHNLVMGLGERTGVAFALMWEIFLWSMAGAYGGGTSNTRALSGAAGAAGYYGKASAAKSVMTAGITYEWLVNVAADLRAQNAKAGAMSVVVPPAFTAELLQEGVLTGISDQASAKEFIIGGKAGRVGGIDIYESNIITKGGYWSASLQDNSTIGLTALSGTGSTAGYHVFGGNLKEAIAFVKQINKPKVTDAEKGFYSNVMQLTVYDGVLVDPSSFFDAIIY